MLDVTGVRRHEHSRVGQVALSEGRGFARRWAQWKRIIAVSEWLAGLKAQALLKALDVKAGR